MKTIGKVTGVATSGGQHRYAWTEQEVNFETGAYQDKDGAWEGSTTDGYAVELNNNLLAVGALIELQQRGFVLGHVTWECQSIGPYTAGITVDGAAVYTSITTLDFGSTAGFIVTNPSTGVAHIALQVAGLALLGIVSAGTQTLSGQKTFYDGLITEATGVAPRVTIPAVAPATTPAWTVGGTFEPVLSVCTDVAAGTPPMGYVWVEDNGAGFIYGGWAGYYGTTRQSAYWCASTAFAIGQPGGSFTIGQSAVVGGMTFVGGLYISGSPTSGITALTGDVTASGTGSVAATLVTAQSGAHTWAATQTFTLAPVFTDASGTRTALGLGTVATLASDTDTTLAANSDLRVATQKAVKAYVDASVVGLLDFKGSQACAANPNYPAASKGDAYYVSSAGKIGGASGKSVDIGDVFIASADNAGGTEASVGTSWFVLEHNLTGALVAANNLSDLASASAARTNLGLGTLATQSGTFSGTSSGTNSGDVTLAGETYITIAGQVITAAAVNLSGTQATGTLAAARMPALTGDVTTVAGAVATTIGANKVTLAMMATMATTNFLGRTTAGTGNVESLTPAQATALLSTFVTAGGSAAKGLVPSPGATAYAQEPLYLGSDAAFHTVKGQLVSAPSFVATGETTTSGTPVDLATVQSLSFTPDVTGQKYVVKVSASVANNTAGAVCRIYVYIDAVSTLVGQFTCTNANTNYNCACVAFEVTGNTGGIASDVRIKFAVSGGTGTFSNRAVEVKRSTT